MTDNEVQREIEENERRKRDESEVGLEEDTLVDDNDSGTILDDLGEAVFGDDDESRRRDVEYDDDNRGTNKFIPD